MMQTEFPFYWRFAASEAILRERREMQAFALFG